MKSKKDLRQSFRLTRNGFRIRPDDRLYLAKVGDVRVRWSRHLPSEPSSVTIIHAPDGTYFASFVVDAPAIPLPATRCEAGVDLGVTRLATIANTCGGYKHVTNPRFLESKLRKLHRLEREKCRRQKGSRNRDKSRRKVAITHAKIARARRDYHHKEALTLVRENQVIYVEDLNTIGMVRNHRLARAIADAGWAQFVRVIGEKCETYGRTLHPVSRWLPSSKTCSACGYLLEQLPLQIRTWTCPACQVIHDRDHNAAKVVLAAGRAESRNACGAPVNPSSAKVRDDEAGSVPTVA